MKIKLVFDDWRLGDVSVYRTCPGVYLSSGDFHSGSMFDATITLDAEQEAELAEAIEKGFRPIFKVTK